MDSSDNNYDNTENNNFTDNNHNENTENFTNNISNNNPINDRSSHESLENKLKSLKVRYKKDKEDEDKDSPEREIETQEKMKKLFINPKFKNLIEMVDPEISNKPLPTSPNNLIINFNNNTYINNMSSPEKVLYRNPHYKFKLNLPSSTIPQTDYMNINDDNNNAKEKLKNIKQYIISDENFSKQSRQILHNNSNSNTGSNIKPTPKYNKTVDLKNFKNFNYFKKEETAPEKYLSKSGNFNNKNNLNSNNSNKFLNNANPFKSLFSISNRSIEFYIIILF
jgi:hypothetical protein